MTDDTLADRVLAGDPRAIARAITLVENDTAAGASLLSRLYPHTGRAYLVGVTGAPGAGKSTLVDRLTSEIRSAGQTVGIIAVDPTSPFSGGAVLGDRVRMSAHAGDTGVFIRSMATRGHLGGLARTTDDAALVLDASGKAVVIIETVGVGQDEVEIVRTADVATVVLVPGTGDDVQAMKAGLMEIADIFVVNKADREGADRLVQAVTASVALQALPPDGWRPPVLQTVATTGTGVAEWWATVLRFRDQTRPQRRVRQRARVEARLRDRLTERLLRRATDALMPGELDRIVEDVMMRRVDPHTAVDRIAGRLPPVTRPGASPQG